MRQINRSVVRWRRVGALLGLLILALASPRDARAACGPAHRRPIVEIAGFDALARSGALAPIDGTAPIEKTPRCPSGVCSSRPRPPLAPRSAPPMRLDQWPHLVAGYVLVLPSRSLGVPDEAPAYVRPILAHVERPPRPPVRSSF